MCFADIGSNLVGIETAYSAILRGVYFSTSCSKEIAENYSWNVLLINTNSYAIFSLVGTRLVDYQEVPLAIKSFSMKKLIRLLQLPVSQILPDYPAKKIINSISADDICAEVLKHKLYLTKKLKQLIVTNIQNVRLLMLHLKLQAKKLHQSHFLLWVLQTAKCQTFSIEYFWKRCQQASKPCMRLLHSLIRKSSLHLILSGSFSCACDL